MADPVWVDSTVIGFIADGDTALEAELVALSAGGEKLMVPKVKEEVSLGNPFKKGSTMGPTAGSQARDEVIKRLNIQVDMNGDPDVRRQLFETQFKFKAPGKGTAVRAMEESDAIVLSEVAASAKARGVSNPRFLTGDQRLVNNADAKLWKVAILGRNSPPTPPGFTGGRLSPTADIPLNIGPSARGQANGSAMVAAFMVVDGLLNYLNSRFLADEVGEQVNSMGNSIRNWQISNPTDGALVAVNFARTELTPDPLGVMKNRMLIHPGNRLEGIDVFFAPTPEEAANLLRGQRSWVQGDVPDGPYQTVRTRTVFWVAPRIKEVLLTSPVGQWRVQVDRWTWIYEFSPQGNVTWTDIFNRDAGQGKWTIVGDQIKFEWSSKTIERWKFPLRPSNETGSCQMEAGKFTLKAVKL